MGRDSARVDLMGPTYVVLGVLRPAKLLRQQLHIFRGGSEEDDTLQHLDWLSQRAGVDPLEQVDLLLHQLTLGIGARYYRSLNSRSSSLTQNKAPGCNRTHRLPVHQYHLHPRAGQSDHFVHELLSFQDHVHVCGKQEWRK